jgi:3-oxoacyl-[acyl-carrier protein] reductase
MDLGLKGKVALVTGGARDVGREVAVVLAAEGARVAVNYSRSAEAADALVDEIEAGGGIARAYRCDVADYSAVRGMVEDIVKDLEGIDVLVNNAGFVIPGLFTETKPDDWKPQIDVGLYGVIHCCHAVVPHMIEQKLARELGPSGITVNCVAFGLVETSHIDQIWLDKNYDKIIRQYPLGRIGKANDIAPAIAFLASAEASWITGQILSINGGYAMVG